jgi:hypothetical protein
MQVPHAEKIYLIYLKANMKGKLGLEGVQLEMTAFMSLYPSSSSSSSSSHISRLAFLFVLLAALDRP